MYEDLIKNLRHDSASALQNCEFDFIHDWMLKAANAIEELQKQLRDEKVDNVNLTGWLAEEHHRLDDAEIENIKLREEFAKYRGKHRWISVTERLPDEEEVVLVWGGASVYTAKRHNKYGGLMWWKLNSKQHYCNPTHWMPLPQPPESKGE